MAYEKINGVGMLTIYVTRRADWLVYRLFFVSSLFVRPIVRRQKFVVILLNGKKSLLQAQQKMKEVKNQCMRWFETSGKRK